jgi:hypothetical protein
VQANSLHGANTRKLLLLLIRLRFITVRGKWELFLSWLFNDAPSIYDSIINESGTVGGGISYCSDPCVCVCIMSFTDVESIKEYGGFSV